MQEFTYEKENIQTPLETYEWDNVWWEQAPDTEKKRILYIGDSISCGLRQILTELADNQFLVDGFGTSKGIDNPFFSDSVRLFAKQQKAREMILFNNGLHGFHLEDSTEYRMYYEKMVQFLMSEFANTPIILVLSTCVADEARNKRVIERNQSVMEIAKQYNLPVIDLYKASEKYLKFRREDGVHFNAEGYQKLAQIVLEQIRTCINK